MTISIAQFLVDFGQPLPIGPDLPDLDMGNPLDIELDVEPADEPIEHRLEQARLEGFAAAEAAGEAALAERVATLEAEHAEQIESVRQGWSVEQGETLERLVRDGLSELESKVAETLADLLLPIVDAALRAKALEEARTTLNQLLAASDEAIIKVSGPEDLVEPLRERMGDLPTLAFEFADSPDLTILAGDSTIRSHLQPWADRLGSAVLDAR